MKKITIIIVLAALCLNFTGYSQAPTPPMKPLSIGDTLTRAVWNIPLQVINHPQGKNTITLDAYRAKQLIIIDFWATWCSSCISHFPKMYLLQQKFSGSLQILLINTRSTRDDEAKIQAFFKSRKQLYQFTSAFNDTSFDQLFPHHSIPHYIWIKNNKVIAITDAEEVNERNIAGVINGQTTMIHEKANMLYNPAKPLFADGNGGSRDSDLYHSFLMRYNEQIQQASAYLYNDKGLVNRVDFINCPLWNLYEHAYPRLGEVNKDRIIFKVKDPTIFSSDSTSRKWKEANCFIYESTFPGVSRPAAQRMMRFDLEKYFSIKVDSQIVNVPCFILRTMDTGKISKARGHVRPESNVFEYTKGPVYFTGMAMKQVANGLETRYHEPFIDETGYPDRVNIHLPENFKDQDALRRSLAEQGFTLTKENRKIVFWILSD